MGCGIQRFVWVVTDVTAQSHCMSSWSRELNGVVTIFATEPCASGMVVLWNRVSMSEAVTAHEPYLSVSASRAEMERFQLAVVPRGRQTVPSGARPSTDCPGTFHATATSTIFSSPTARVQVDQEYQFNSPSCTTKYATVDTASYISGPSGAWKSDQAGLFHAGGSVAFAGDSDAAISCHGLPHSATFNFYALPIGNLYYTGMFFGSKNQPPDCAGGQDGFAQTPNW